MIEHNVSIISIFSFAYKMMVSHKVVREPGKAEFKDFKRFMCNASIFETFKY